MAEPEGWPWGGAEPGALHFTAEAGDEQRVRELLAAGAYVDQPALPEEMRDETPLHLAAREGHAGVVEALLAAGADANACTLYGYTALMLAAGGGHVTCMLPLLAAGADMEPGDEDGWGCLHHWAAWAAEQYDIDQALQRLRPLLESGCEASLAAPGPGSVLGALLLEHLAYESPPWRPLPHMPEMGRLLAGASCPVDREAGELGEGAASVLKAWLSGLKPSSGFETERAYWLGGESLMSQRRWPVALSAGALAVSAELLRCAAPTPRLGGSSYLLDAIMIGDLRLVRLVLEAFPQSVLVPEGQGSTELSSVVGCACHLLCERMSELDFYDPPCDESESESESDEWELKRAAPVLHACKLVAMLLAAGAPPQKAVIAHKRYSPAVAQGEQKDRVVAVVPQELVPLPGPTVTLRLPSWALGPLSFLPLAAAGIEWSPQHHALFPPAFRDAARTLLLMNECRMAGGAVCADLERQRLMDKARPNTFLSRLLGCKPHWERPLKEAALVGPASLPIHLLHHVLRLASRPLPAGVPELAPFVQQVCQE